MKFIATFFFSVMLIGTSFLSTAIAKEGWEIALKQQLLRERKCDVKFLSRVKQFKLGGEDVVDGRAHCTNSLEYDFSWNKQKQKFDIRACKPVVC